MSVPVSVAKRALLVSTALGCAPPDPAIQLGTGELAFEPRSPGDEIEVIRGPQGGYHLLGSMQVRDVEPGNRDRLDDPSNPLTTFTVWDGEVSLAPYSAYRQGLAESDDATWTHEMIGRLVILDIADDDDIVGKTLRFEVALEEASGLTLTDSLELLIVPHPLNDL